MEEYSNLSAVKDYGLADRRGGCLQQITGVFLVIVAGRRVDGSRYRYEGGRS